MRRYFVLVTFAIACVSIGFVLGKGRPAQATPGAPTAQPIIYVNRPDPDAKGGRSKCRLVVLRHLFKDKQLFIAPGVELNQYGNLDIGPDQWVIAIDGHSYLVVEDSR